MRSSIAANPEWNEQMLVAGFIPEDPSQIQMYSATVYNVSPKFPLLKGVRGMSSKKGIRKKGIKNQKILDFRINLRARQKMILSDNAAISQKTKKSRPRTQVVDDRCGNCSVDPDTA
jgi:hypothetical protein